MLSPSAVGLQPVRRHSRPIAFTRDLRQRRRRILRRVDVRHLTAADPGWRAVFDDDSLVRIVAWAVSDRGVVGLIVDPSNPTQIVAAPEATTPDGFSFAKYGFRADSDR
jgi:hypothetical protein